MSISQATPREAGTTLQRPTVTAFTVQAAQPSPSFTSLQQPLWALGCDPTRKQVQCKGHLPYLTVHHCLALQPQHVLVSHEQCAIAHCKQPHLQLLLQLVQLRPH